MDKPEEEDFTLTFDAGDDSGGYAGDVLDKKVESLGWRVTLLTIIVPCLMAVIVIMAYFGITKKVADFQDTGSAEVRHLTDMYEEKLSTIRRDQEKWQADVTAELADIGKKTTDFEKKIIAGLKTVESRADKAVQSAETLRRDIGRLEGQTAAVDKKATSASGSVEALRGELKLIGTALDGLKKEKADQVGIDRRLAEMNKATQTAAAEWEKRTAVLLKRLEGLEKRLAVMEGAGTSGRSSPVEPLPDNRGILEEDLSR